jgi:hypothetical protein
MTSALNRIMKRVPDGSTKRPGCISLEKSQRLHSLHPAVTRVITLAVQQGGLSTWVPWHKTGLQRNASFASSSTPLASVSTYLNTNWDLLMSGVMGASLG